MPASSDVYCTYFDDRYAAQGLAMIRSLRAAGGEGAVWVLCLNERAEEIVRAFDVADVHAIPLAAVEAHFPALATARGDRSLIEYYFTLTPHLVRYVFDTVPEAVRVAYLDGDLFFFGDVDEMWAASSDAPVAIIPHSFNPGAGHLARYGTYNVGWVGFRRSAQGLACLDFWVRSCADWCGDVPDGDRFADQGYLTRFHEFAPDLVVIAHRGCNLGPWNVGRYRSRLVDGRVMVDGDRLIFFHFTGFKKGLRGRWFNSHRLYRAGTTRVVRDHIYRPYLAALMAARGFVTSRLPLQPAGAVTLVRNRGGGVPIKARLHKLAETAYRVADLVTGRSLPEPAASASNSSRDRI